MNPFRFVMTGGGTGGHVFPALAVANILRARGHRLLFIGTKEGIESRIVHQAGYEMQFIRITGLNRVGLWKALRSAIRLPASIFAAFRILRRFRPGAIFSTGGYVAGPVMIAAVLAGIPLIVMEPNAIPGFANRKIAGRVTRALLGFESSRAWFPPAKSEVTGLPVRAHFFSVPPKRNGIFTVLITGGSRGARSLNRASRESWPLFRKNSAPVRIIHQTGLAEHQSLAAEFQSLGLDGEILPFIEDMPSAFARADLVVGRAGAGAVSEIAAAGMPSILVPLPFAADDHQKKNAEAFSDAGAARLILDADLNGASLFHEIDRLRQNPDELRRMRENVRAFARPGAAERAAQVLEEAACRT